MTCCMRNASLKELAEEISKSTDDKIYHFEVTTNSIIEPKCEVCGHKICITDVALIFGKERTLKQLKTKENDIKVSRILAKANKKEKKTISI